MRAEGDVTQISWPHLSVRRVGRDKVAALGVRISRWVTTHGFALNVTTDLGYYDLITPCGIRDRGVTSLERLLGERPSMSEVKVVVADCFGEVFG